MRQRTIAAIVVALLSGSAWAQSAGDYRTVQQICLFSPFLSPAESAVAVQTLKLFGDTAGGIGLLDDFQTSSPKNEAGVFRSAESAIMATVSPLNRVFVSTAGDWGSKGHDMSERILGVVNDWTNFALTAGGDRVDENMTFTLSSVPVQGLEHNGYVAGFNFKF